MVLKRLRYPDLHEKLGIEDFAKGKGFGIVGVAALVSSHRAAQTHLAWRRQEALLDA